MLPKWLTSGYLRLMEPIASLFIKLGVHPNVITVAGTLFTILGGAMYGSGMIVAGGWVLGVTAFTDVLDGMVARRTGKTSAFGAFLDSTLDRVADGAVLSGLAVFYATDPQYRSTAMLVVCLIGIVGSLLTSYTRARAEAVGIDAKVGLLQRPERSVLLAAPQGLFGLAFNGRVLSAIIILLAVTSWITVAQRIAFVYSHDRGTEPEPSPEPEAPPARSWGRPSRRETTARTALKGE